MRWIYFNDNPEEAAEREAIVAKIDEWWHAFEGKVDDLRAHFKGKARWDLPQWMDDNLNPIQPKIMWEYGPAVRSDGQGDHVLAVENGMLARKPVTVVRSWSRGELIEVDGVEAGMTIVAAALRGLKPGQAVKVLELR